MRPGAALRAHFACSPVRNGCYGPGTLAFANFLKLKRTTYAEPVDWKR